MAVVRKGRSLILSAASDSYQFPIRCRQVRFIGNTLTAGQRLLIKEVDTNGAVIADHYVTSANEDTIIWEAGDSVGSWIRKPFLDAVPAAGTFTVLFQLS